MIFFVFSPKTTLMAVTAATHFCHQFSVVSVPKHSDTDEMMLFLCLIRSHYRQPKPTESGNDHLPTLVLCEPRLAHQV